MGNNLGRYPASLMAHVLEESVASLDEYVQSIAWFAAVEFVIDLQMEILGLTCMKSICKPRTKKPPQKKTTPGWINNSRLPSREPHQWHPTDLRGSYPSWDLSRLLLRRARSFLMAHNFEAVTSVQGLFLQYFLKMAEEHPGNLSAGYLVSGCVPSSRRENKLPKSAPSCVAGRSL